MKKKILYVITKSNYGGAQRYVFDLATNLDPKKYDVAIVLGGPHEGESGKGMLLSKLHERKIRTIVIPKLGRDIKLHDEISVFFTLRSVIREERPDVLHVNSSKAGGIGALVGRFARVKKIIFTVHGFAWNEPRPEPERRLIKFLSWLTLVLSHKNIFVVSRDLEAAQHWPLVKNKLHLIYNGIEKTRLLPHANARLMLARSLKELGEAPSEESIWIGSITEFIKNKGIEYLIEAFAEILNHGTLPPNAHLVLIGGGEGKNRIMQRAEELGVAARVHFAGFIPNASHLLPAFDMFVISSLKEGLPYVLLEAGLARVPIVATAVGEIPNVLTQGETGLLVASENSDELARDMSAYISDPESREKMAKNFRQKVEKEFSKKKIKKKTLALYYQQSRREGDQFPCGNGSPLARLLMSTTMLTPSAYASWAWNGGPGSADEARGEGC